MSRKNWGALGCAAFVGVAVAFPAGVMFGERHAVRHEHGSEAQSGEAPDKANFRTFYSPKFHDDPYVQDRWRKEVDAMEARCRDAGEHCAEAKAARRWLDEKR